MLKRNIQKVFKKYIKDILEKDEVYPLRRKPVGPDAASLEVKNSTYAFLIIPKPWV